MGGGRQDGDVVVLASRDRPKRPGRETAGVAAAYLTELDRCLLCISPRATWSPQGWMIASTPFRMRLVGARARLAELPALRSLPDQSDRWWFLELQAALEDAEQRICALEECLLTLQHKDALPAVRLSEAKAFVERRRHVMSASRRIRDLLCQQFPEMAAP